MANQHVECRLPQRLEGGAQVQMFRGVVAPFLGLTAFWTCFRYQGFLVGLFPYESLVTFGGVCVPSSSVFLLALVVIAGVALTRWRLLSDLLSKHRRLAAIVAISGVLGAFVLAYWPGAPLAVYVAASIMVACGLLACFLMWTGYLATGPSGATMHKLLLALLAYPCSVACMYVSFTVWGNDATVHLPPFRLLLCVVAWLVSRQPDGAPAVCDRNVHQPVALVDLTDVFLGACATCILGGTVIRGVIDNGISPAMGVRTVVVLLLSAIALSLVVLSVPVARRLETRRIGGAPVRALDMALPACWAVLAFTFLGGTLLYLSGIAETLGAYVATASCSLQLVLFYILLADKARRLSVSFVPVMLVYGLMDHLGRGLIDWRGLGGGMRRCGLGLALRLKPNDGIQNVAVGGVERGLGIGVAHVALGADGFNFFEVVHDLSFRSMGATPGDLPGLERCVRRSALRRPALGRTL